MNANKKEEKVKEKHLVQNRSKTYRLKPLGFVGFIILSLFAVFMLTNSGQQVTAGNSSLSYDATTDQYNYVWKTDKNWAETCRVLVVQLNDGSFHSASFKFK